MKQIFFAQKALIVKDDRLLMIRKSKFEKPNPLKWDVPGGRMDCGEEIDASLAREVYEEIGVKVNIGRPYYFEQHFVTRPSKTEGEEPLEMQIVAVYRACVALDDKFSNKNNVENDQVEIIEWVPVDEILKLDLMKTLIDVMKDFVKDMKARKIEFPSR